MHLRPPLAARLLLAGAFAAALAIGLPARGALAQAAATPQAEASDDNPLTQAELEQILAPIALYPDTLLMQVLMASTYPLEVVQAKRWLGQGQNAQLRGDALAQALVAQTWDPSVKSLVPFPDVLTMMNDQLDWTQKVGDAVLGQQQDVMNAVQVLRSRAQANGQLNTGPQQTVVVTQNAPAAAPAAGGAPAPTVVQAPPQTIVIQPTDPEQVYVPAYNPSVVYGSWPYPASPPAYYPPPVGWNVGNALLTGMAFAGGVAVVNSLWGWARPGWGGGNVDIDVNRYNNINANRNRISNNNWQHDVSHRHGVAYRNDQTRARVGAERPGGADRAHAREQFRGRVDHVERGGGIADHRPGGPGNLGDRGGPGGPGGPGGLGNRGGPGEHGGLGNRGGPGDRGGVGDRAQAGQQLHRPQGGGAAARPNQPHRQLPGNVQHAATGRPQIHQPAQQRGPQGFQGVGQGSHDRAAAQRGAASRHGQAAARPAGRGGGGGGMHHGGGGRGGRHR